MEILGNFKSYPRKKFRWKSGQSIRMVPTPYSKSTLNKLGLKKFPGGSFSIFSRKSFECGSRSFGCFTWTGRLERTPFSGFSLFECLIAWLASSNVQRNSILISFGFVWCLFLLRLMARIQSIGWKIRASARVHRATIGRCRHDVHALSLLLVIFETLCGDLWKCEACPAICYFAAVWPVSFLVQSILESWFFLVNLSYPAQLVAQLDLHSWFLSFSLCFLCVFVQQCVNLVHFWCAEWPGYNFWTLHSPILSDCPLEYEHHIQK